MKNKFLPIFVSLIPLGILSSCSDFRKAVGTEKIIPDESILLTIKTSKEEILDLRIGFIRYFFF